MVVDLGAQGADDGAGVAVHEGGGAGSRLVDDLGAVGIGQDGNGTGRDGIGGEASSAEAGAREKRSHKVLMGMGPLELGRRAAADS